MILKLGTVLIAVLQVLPFSAAVPYETLATRASTGVCQTGFYGEVVQKLGNYQPALAFCAIFFPPSCPAGGKVIRGRTNRTPPTTTTTTTRPGANPTPCFLSLKSAGRAVASTACSCLGRYPSCSSSTTTSRSSSTTTTSTTTTTTTTTTSACVPPAATNAIPNGGFESGQLSPWVWQNNGFSGSESQIVTYPGSGAQGTASYFLGVQRDDGTKSYSLTQTGIPLAGGTLVSCTAWVSVSRNPGYTTTYTLTVDGTPCGSVTRINEEAWYQFGSNVLVSGDTHTVQITVTSTGTDEAGSLADVDEISLLPIAGPGFPTC